MDLLLKPLITLLAVILVFEEWLWDTLKAQLKRLSALPVVGRVERCLTGLPPWASLLVLIVPGAVLLPFKLAGLWALSHGHPLLGVLIFVAAKLTGTAVAAYLFDLVRESARRMAWFDRFYVWTIALLSRARAWLRARPAYQAAHAMVVHWNAWTRVRLAGLSGDSSWSRNLRTAKAAIRGARAGQKR